MNYYLKWRDEVTGPFSEQDLAKQYRSKKLTRFHLVSLNQADWLPLTSLRSVTDPDYRPDETAATETRETRRRHPTVKLSMPLAPSADSNTEPPHAPAQAVAQGSSARIGADRQSSTPPSVFVTPDLLCDPKEGVAFCWLVFFSIFTWLGLITAIIFSFGLALPVIALMALVAYFGELFSAAYIKTHAVRVSAIQIPELYRIINAFAQQLGQPLPAVYVIQENTWNALAIKLAGRRMVVLFSGAVDALLAKGSTTQLAWLAGHELGHHFAGHLNFGRRLTERFGSWFFWVELWYKRRCEFTCDRYGLACACNLEESMRAVCSMAVGGQLAPLVNTEEAINQWRRCRTEFFVKYRNLYSTHPATLWRLEELMMSAREIGIPN